MKGQVYTLPRLGRDMNLGQQVNASGSYNEYLRTSTGAPGEYEAWKQQQDPSAAAQPAPTNVNEITSPSAGLPVLGQDPPPMGAMEPLQPKPGAAGMLPFDPSGTGYDYDSAKAAGMGPTGTGENAGHWGSVAPAPASAGLPDDSYMMLKGRQHETWGKGVAGEEARGSRVMQLGDRSYSVPLTPLPQTAAPAAPGEAQEGGWQGSGWQTAGLALAGGLEGFGAGMQGRPATVVPGIVHQMSQERIANKQLKLDEKKLQGANAGKETEQVLHILKSYTENSKGKTPAQKAEMKTAYAKMLEQTKPRSSEMLAHADRSPDGFKLMMELAGASPEFTAIAEGQDDPVKYVGEKADEFQKDRVRQGMKHLHTFASDLASTPEGKTALEDFRKAKYSESEGIGRLVAALKQNKVPQGVISAVEIALGDKEGKAFLAQHGVTLGQHAEKSAEARASSLGTEQGKTDEDRYRHIKDPGTQDQMRQDKLDPNEPSHLAIAEERHWAKKAKQEEETAAARERGSPGTAELRQELKASPIGVDPSKANADQIRQAINQMQERRDASAAKHGENAVKLRGLDAAAAAKYGGLKTAKRSVEEIVQTFSDKQITKYAGMIPNKWESIQQLLKGDQADPEFGRFLAVLSRVQAGVFDTGGKALTPHESVILFGFIPTGTELNSVVFKEKVRYALATFDTQMHDVLDIATTTVGDVSKLRPTGEYPVYQGAPGTASAAPTKPSAAPTGKPRGETLWNQAPVVVK